MRPAPTLAGAGLCLLAGLSLPLVLDCYAGSDPADPAAPGAASSAPAPEPGAPQEAPPEDPLVLLDAAFASPALPLDPATAGLLGERDWAGASAAVAALDVSALGPGAAADKAFLQGWIALRLGKVPEAVAQLPALDGSGAAPRPYLDLLRAEILLADGQALPAAQILEAQAEGSSALWPRARLQLAEAYWKLERTSDARAVWEALAARPDPADGSATALLALARRSGLGSDEAYPILRRLWRAYPGSAEDGAAKAPLAAYEARAAAFKPSLADQAARAGVWMERERWSDAIKLTQPLLPALTEPSPDACRIWYAHGRSQFKANNLTAALALLDPAGERCAEHEPDAGARALYLAGKVLERRKDWAGAAARYQRIPELYPEHSMADDGLCLAGIGWQEAGVPAQAQAAWTAQVERYPQGDMAGEGFWRIAWSTWLAGDTPGALAWVDQAAELLGPTSDPVHRQAALYWRWRWRLYGDREHPDVLTADADAREQAIAGLLALCRDEPWSYYALLAAARLHELAPERLAELGAPAWGSPEGAWQVRASFAASAPARNALGLARLGLLAEAVAELEELPAESLIPGEVGAFTDLMTASGRWIWAHDRLRRYLDEHPVATLRSNQARLLSAAYPPRYEAELRAACTDYTWDPLLFLGLVREESNFNKDIVSHAGARGLSQLMPATARAVAKWLGTTVSNQGMFDEKTNLRIGARYLEYLMGRYGQDPFLSLAGYNAGEGNVDKWLRERGNRPVDEFVEAIPLRETRHYVKRVSSSWQMYRLLDGAPALFPDLSAYNECASPGDT